MNPKIIRFAIEAHQNVNQDYNGAPYSLHLAMAAIYAERYKDCVPDQVFPDVLSAVWLHDTIEDCRLNYNNVKKVAGEVVADLVYAVSNEKGKNRAERANDAYYTGIRNTPFATFVKLCDRLANAHYSKSIMSRMVSMYAEEHDSFIEKLFDGKYNPETSHYRPMVAELEAILGKEK